MASQYTSAHNEANDKGELRNLQQQTQELPEKVLLLTTEIEKLKSKFDEVNDKDKLITLQQQKIQALREEVLTLVAENKNLKRELDTVNDKDVLRTPPQYIQKLQENGLTRDRYQKTLGALNMEGIQFCIMMASLIYSRCQARNRHFLLASDMGAAAPFDDIVLSLENNIVFIQLKHFSLKNKHINESTFFQTFSCFNLIRYFKGYLDIKKKWNNNADLKRCGDFSNAVFVLYTNARMAKTVSTETVASQPDETSDWQSIISTSGKCVQVSRKSHPHFYQFFESLSRDREILLDSRDGENEQDITGRFRDQRMLRDMCSMEQLPEYENFLSHLWIFTEQKNCHKLQFCFKNELCELWNLSHKNTDSISMHFLTQMHTWWRGGGYFLNGNTEIWNEMITTLAKNISKEKIKELKGLGIKFDTQELNKVREIIEGRDGLICIVSVNSIMMTVLKVYQALDSCMLVDIIMLQNRKKEIMSLWRWCTVLVVIVDTKKNADVLPKPPPGRTLVAISKHVSNKTYHYSDDFCLEQLDEYCRTRVLFLPVKFQGCDSTLWELLGTDPKPNIAINGDMILDMLKGNKLSLENELPDQPDFLIPRALIRKCAVKPSILTAQANATLAVSGIDERDIIKIIPPEESSNSSNKITVLSIQDEEDFNKIKTKHQNIHWLHYENEVLYWRKSEGDISLIRKFLKEENLFAYKNFSTAHDVEGSVVILSAEPGMGKSTLLINVARNTALVLRVNLIDCVNEVQKLVRIEY